MSTTGYNPYKPPEGEIHAPPERPWLTPAQQAFVKCVPLFGLHLLFLFSSGRDLDSMIVAAAAAILLWLGCAGDVVRTWRGADARGLRWASVEILLLCALILWMMLLRISAFR